MKAARVIKPFKDKNTRKVYRSGAEIEVTDERFEEINSTAHGLLVEEINLPKSPKKASPKMKKPAKKK